MNEPFRTAWIIGASSGIGRELAKLMARAGIIVTVSARRGDALEELRSQCPNGKIYTLPLDIADPDAVDKAAKTMEQGDRLPDVVVIASAIYEAAAVDDLDPSLFAKVMTVNYLGVVNLLSAMVPGHVAVVASVAGYGLPLAAAYGPTKAAVINLCESLQPELKARGVHLQVINPGFVDTPMTRKNSFAMPFMISPEDAARRLYRGLLSRRFEITFPKPYGLYFRLIGTMTGASQRGAEKQS
jgi:NAD(P)-dependent dehydrogenase (short-subunit alcohol dehydrogenase family)